VRLCRQSVETEVLAEVVAALFQFLLEVLLQLAADVFAELGIEALKEVRKASRQPRPLLAGFGYVLLGLTGGWVSLWWFPKRFAGSTEMRLMTLVLAPAMSALALWMFLTVIGRPVASEERRRRFWLAYAFGLAFALVRFTYGR
jgi:hypothetical protein